MSDKSQARKLRMEADILFDKRQAEVIALRAQNKGLVEEARDARAVTVTALAYCRRWRLMFWWMAAMAVASLAAVVILLCERARP